MAHIARAEKPVHKSIVLFRVSDVVNHPLRNYKRYPEVDRILNVPYGGGVPARRKMDLYFSSSARKNGGFPVLFNVHGGGFVAGGKKYRSGIARYFASRGWFVVNIDYALAPAEVYPAALEDCMLALNEVNALADKYPLDLTKIVVTGDSAGGYYAAQLVAAIYDDGLRRSLGLTEYKGAKPRALLTFCAPFEPVKCLSGPAFGSVATDIAECLFGKELTPGGRREFEKGKINVTANVNSGWCECFIVEAERDGFCGGQLADMAKALNSAGVPYGYYVASEKRDGHCTHLFPFLAGSGKTLSAVNAFLDRIAGRDGRKDKTNDTSIGKTDKGGL